jgi:phage repressor protein C with HTH and peptisase S24 domain
LAFDPFEQTDRHLLLSVAELGARAHHDLRAVRVGGTSMEPLIPEGSVVVLDLADRDFVDGRIYAVAVEEGGVEMVATVKRVRRMDGAFVLWPENSAYSPQIARGDWSDICVGRVVWLWRSLERA